MIPHVSRTGDALAGWKGKGRRGDRNARDLHELGPEVAALVKYPKNFCGVPGGRRSRR